MMSQYQPIRNGLTLTATSYWVSWTNELGENRQTCGNCTSQALEQVLRKKEQV